MQDFFSSGRGGFLRRGVRGPLKGPEKILNLDARRGRLKVDFFENSTPKIYFPFHFISAFDNFARPFDPELASF